MEDLILFVGTPNAGKTTLFNRMTHAGAHVGNWHGVTVDALEKRTQVGAKTVTFVDLPGLYASAGGGREEGFAHRYILSHPAAIVFVSEYAALPRTVQLIKKYAQGRRCMLVLTKKRSFLRAGGMLEESALSARLGFPVYDSGARGLKARMGELLSARLAGTPDCTLSGVFRPPREELPRVDRILLRDACGLPLFALFLLFAFLMTFAKGFPGDLMKRGIDGLIGRLDGRAARISSPVLCSFVRFGILKSVGGVLCFLPQITLLHFFLLLLEESGLMSRLAVLTDGFLARFGLSGRAVFSLLMGFGCTAAAITSTRGLDRVSRKKVILCLPYLSCSAKLPVYLAIAASFFEDPFPAVLLLYAAGIGIAFLVAFAVRGERTPLLMELAPLQLPRPLFVAKSLLFQVKQFIIKVGTTIFAFLLLSWLLSSFDGGFALCPIEESMLAHLCGGLKFLFAPVGMADWRIAYAALSGLIAKENVAGALSMLLGGFPYGGASGCAFSVFMLTCSPCISAIAAAAREIGMGRAALLAALQTVSALLLCYLVYFALTGGVATLLLCAVALLAFCISGIRFERVYRRKKLHPEGIHRRHRSAGVALSAHAPEGAAGPRQRRKGGGERPSEGGGPRRLFPHPRAGGEGGVRDRLPRRKPHRRR